MFYEGPPTANGKPGIHHVMARTLKDSICRYKTMKGFQVNRKAGWDTHGLPVEIEVEKQLNMSGKQDIEKYGIKEFNEKCKAVSYTHLAVQFASGWHLPLDKCEIVKRPEYEDGSFCLPMREEYKKAYNVFGRIEGKEVFLGVAFYDDNDKKLVADKVFYVR